MYKRSNSRLYSKVGEGCFFGEVGLPELKFPSEVDSLCQCNRAVTVIRTLMEVKKFESGQSIMFFKMIELSIGYIDRLQHIMDSNGMGCSSLMRLASAA